MRNLIKVLGLFLIILILVVSSITIYTKDAKRQETREAIVQAMEQAMNNLTEDDLKALNEKDLADYFVSQVAARVGSVNKGMDVSIYGIDYAQGFIDAEVTAYFNYILGGSTVKVRKTLYIDEYTQKQQIAFGEHTTGEEESREAFSLSASNLSADSELESNPVGYMADKNVDTYWQSEELEEAAGSSGEEVAVNVNLKEICYIKELTITWGDDYAKAFSVQVSKKGTDWVTVHEAEKTDSSPDRIDMKETAGCYIRIICRQPKDGAQHYQIKEITASKKL